MSGIEPPGIVTQAQGKHFAAAFYDFRKAKVPGIDFFNPAIVRRADGLWLVTRRSEFLETFEFGYNELMAFSLDDDHLPLYGKPIYCDKFSSREHFEDPRAVFHNNRWWLSACNFVVYAEGDGAKTWTGAHQVLLEIDDDWRTHRRHDPIYGKNGAGVFEQKGDEKNWLWFSHEGELHLIYQTLPHMIVRWDEALRPVEEYETEVWLPGWHYGHPRGGTAPIRVGRQFISFFHSSMPWRAGKRRYYMGAYAFEAAPPFHVTAVTPKPLLVGSLEDPWAEGKPLVVFPCAALHEYGVWTISLGVNDLVSARAMISDAVLAHKLSRDVKKTPPRPKELSAAERIYA
jgi:predicted GH43/DUF377 family glycosyl hydrolase